jgi:hypothetical protein
MFVDAYSMAPYASKRRSNTPDLFNVVRNRLPGERSPYEEAWHSLAAGGTTYPNSAVFLEALWPGYYSLLLCETDKETARELRTWVDAIRRSPTSKCFNAEIAEGDWRDRFRRGLPVSGDLTFLSFDPYSFDRNGPGPGGPNGGKMNPCDLGLLADAVKPFRDGVIIQISTYSARNNPQQAVIDIVRPLLEREGFETMAVVRANDQMMSLVLGRDVEWAASLHSLCARLESWLKQAKTPLAGGNMKDPILEEIVRFLNHEQVRATYGAVAEVLSARRGIKVLPQSMGARLGPRYEAASWIVNATTGLPTGYGREDMHPALLGKREIFRSGKELEQRLARWKSAR